MSKKYFMRVVTRNGNVFRSAAIEIEGEQAYDETIGELFSLMDSRTLKFKDEDGTAHFFKPENIDVLSLVWGK